MANNTSALSGAAAGSLIVRSYDNFRGVDFSSFEVSQYRSPDSLNMWKNYKNLGKCIESRPDLKKVLEFNNTIFGIFFYTINQVEHMIIHCGVSLYDYNMKTKELEQIKEMGMNTRRSQSFIFNNIFYIKDGLNFLRYDGESLIDVIGFIPTTLISGNPKGGGTKYQNVNMLSKYRKNSFVSDGKTKEYKCNVEEFTSSIVKVWINDILLTTGYTVDITTGTVNFTEAPPEPDTTGQDNVIIQFEKEVPGYKERILKCTLLSVFDNRVFFSGNKDFPNTLWNSSLEDPSYCNDQDYYVEGLDLSPIRAIVPGNNALWVFKEPSEANTTVFYHTPTIDSEYGKIYPSTHSNVAIGCVSTGINFNDDIVFFSPRGMEGISGDITKEQVISHRSIMIDSKLLSEERYKDLILQEWLGYLFVIIGKKVFLADSRAMFTNENHNEYEWFYWELDKTISNSIVKEDILYLCTEAEEIKDNNGYIKCTNGTNIFWLDTENQKLYDSNYILSNESTENLEKVEGSAIYTLEEKDTNILAYWCTCMDSFKYPQMLKSTNKKGCIADITGTSVDIEVRIDKNEFEKIGTFENTKDYIVPKIKFKKWKDIQVKISSKKPFSLERLYLESYVGSYIKR